MMLSLALSMAVLTSSGGLLSEHLPAGVRLLDAASVVPGALLGARDRDEGGISLGEVQAMSLDQLHAEYDRLEDEKPGLGLGIGLLAGGIAGIVTSIIIWAVVGYTLAGAVVGLIFFLAGIALTITGPIIIASSARERRRYSRDQDVIMRQIRAREGGGGQQLPALPSGPNPPPPPPPPPLGGLPVVEPQLVLASF